MIEQLTTSFMLPAAFFYVVAFVFGVIFGSFLDVCLCRFHTGKSIGGSSHCMSCGKRLRWYELFPLLSFALQLGRCRGCGSRIPGRLCLMEVATGSLFGLALWSASSVVELGWLLVLLLVLLFITVYDWLHFIIPDEATIALTALTVVWVGYDWFAGVLTLTDVGVLVGASIAGAGFFFFLWFVSGGKWLGFGDVKLAIPLGLWVGAAGVFSYIVLSFWVGAAISLSILAYQKYYRGKQFLHLKPESLTMKSAVPFAPFMIIGAGLVYFFNLDVLSLFSFTI